MKHLVRALIPLLLTAVFSCPTDAFAAPKGAVRLTADKLAKKSGFYCGYLKKNWVPGKIVSGNFFYSHATERANLQKDLKKAKGKRKKSLQSKIKTLTKQINQRASACAGGKKSSSRVRFDLTGARALVLSNSAQAASAFKYARRSVGSFSDGNSNLKKVLDNGALAPAFAGTKGSVSISKFLVGPNDTLYILFNFPICLDDPTSYNCGKRCLLAEVNTGSGDVTCIESELSNIYWNYNSNTGVPSAKPIQFDSAGNIYYLGYGSMTQLRRYSVATRTTSDIINQNINISGFLVLGDGSIILSGRTESSNSYWLRKKFPGAEGELVNIATISPSWLSTFPDGRIYMGGSSGGNGSEYYAIQRMSRSSTILDPNNWLESNIYYLTTAYNYFSGNIFPLVALHQTPDRHVYALSGNAPNLSLIEVYPHPHTITTSIPRISGLKPVLSDLIIFGTDTLGNGKMVLYNTTSNQEVDLLGGRNIEVYRAEFSASDNTVRFDGLRFSDGRYVLCTVEIAFPNPVCSPTGSTKLADFQSISTPGVGLPPPDITPTPLPLVSYDVTGAKAVFSAILSQSSGVYVYEAPRKITAGAVVTRLSSYDDTGVFFRSLVRGDDQGNLWLVGKTFLTDTDAAACKLAKINKATGGATCVYDGGGDVGVIKTSPAGRTYFAATTNPGADPTTSLWSYSDGTLTRLVQTLGGEPVDAIITSDGGILLARGGAWIKKSTSSGVVTNLGNLDGSRFGKFSDGRIVLFQSSYIKILNDTGSAVLSNDWVSDVGCPYNTGWTCSGYGQNVFTLSNGSSYADDPNFGLRRFFPGPITSVSLATTFKNYHSIPNFSSFAPSDTSFNNTIFFGGRTTAEENKLISYNASSEEEVDLTDDPNFLPISIMYNAGDLYLYGLRNGQIVAGVKDLSVGGGTTLSTVAPANYYNTLAPGLVPVNP